jgi:hypothetical protein
VGCKTKGQETEKKGYKLEVIGTRKKIVFLLLYRFLELRIKKGKYIRDVMMMMTMMIWWW